MRAGQFRFAIPRENSRARAGLRGNASKTGMEIESSKPDPSMFAHVVYLAAGAILVIIIAAVIIVTWRSHKKNTPPYTKHPVSQLHPVGDSSILAA